MKTKSIKKTGGFTIEKGTCGILVTCHKGKERQAQTEIISILEDNLEQKDSNEQISIDIENELKQEIENLKKKEKKMFAGIQTGIACTVFIRFDLSINPVLFVHELLSKMSIKKIKQSRYCSRIIPISSTCFATISEIKNLAEKIIIHFLCLKNISKY